jgi:hypothetical protein
MDSTRFTPQRPLMDRIFEKATGLPPLSPRSQFLHGHGDEYFHPGTSEAQQLEAQGYHLPQPGDYTYPPINPLCNVHPISAGPLSLNIVNALAAGGTEDHDSNTSKNSKKARKGRTKTTPERQTELYFGETT